MSRSTNAQNRHWRGHVFAGVSLDGFIARGDGDIAWLTDPPAGPEHVLTTSSHHAPAFDEFFADIDHMIMGRNTYQKVRSMGYWPYSGTPVTVLSTTLVSDDPEISIVRSFAEALRRLEASGASHVYLDGGMVVQTFMATGLVDIIDIAWAPVLIGSGISLFGELPNDVRLELTASNTSPGGLVHATYTVFREVNGQHAEQ